MNLLSRIQHVLGTRSKPRREAAWVLSIVAIVVAAMLVCSPGIPSSSAIADDDPAVEAEESSADKADQPRETEAPPEPQDIPDELEGQHPIIGKVQVSYLVQRR